MNTIYALASGHGKAGVAVIRVSGPGAFVACEALSGDVPAPRKAALRVVRDANGDVLDTGLVVTFPGPGSFTGEDVVEFQLHGSVAVVNAVLSALSALDDLVLAEPGEFTRRALLNGKMDLTQVEGLSDLIEAQTEVQRHQAQATLSGAVSDLVSDVREKLIRAVALLEAVMNFADEEVPEDVSDEVVELLDAVITSLNVELAGFKTAERIRSGFEVAIVGAPNVGKSTLLNALAGRDVAITSSYAGTTRDILEVQLDLNGIPVTVLDTAGIRETDDPVESIGVERAVARAHAADIRVFLVDDLGIVGDGFRDGDIVVLSKADQRTAIERAVSGLTGEGVDQLVRSIADTLSERTKGAGLVAHHRQASALEEGVRWLNAGREFVCAGDDSYDLAAEEIRSSLVRLDALVGRVDVDDYLDVIFSSFCLGK